MADIILDDSYIKLIDENDLFPDTLEKRKLDELSGIIYEVLPTIKALSSKYDSIFNTRNLEREYILHKKGDISEDDINTYVEEYKYKFPVRITSPSNYNIWISTTQLLHEIYDTFEKFSGDEDHKFKITKDLNTKMREFKESIKSLITYVYQAISSNDYEKNLVSFNFDLPTKLELVSSYFTAIRREEDCDRPYEAFKYIVNIANHPSEHILNSYIKEHVDYECLSDLISILKDLRLRQSSLSPEKKKVYICALETLIVFKALIGYIYSSTSDVQEFVYDYFDKVKDNDKYSLSEDPEDEASRIIDYDYLPHSGKEIANIRGMFDIASDLDSSSENSVSKSIESCNALISLEAEGMDFGRSQLNSLNRMVATNKFNRYQNNLLNTNQAIYKRKAIKFQKVLGFINKARPKTDSIMKDASFFKTWYGRIPTMYKFYAQEAKVTENRMRGDPTLILSKNGADYLVNMVNYSNKVFSDIVTLAKRIATTGAIPQRINIIKGYCKEFPIQNASDPDAVKTAIKQETSYRIAQAILQDNEVYGFSAEGMAMNGKFPDANHIITSLFIENSHEKPTELSVSEIFQSPESLTAFAFPERVNQFTQLYQKAISLTQNNFNDKVLASIADQLDNTMKNVINQMKRNGADYYKDSGNLEMKEMINMLKGMNSGIKDSFDILIDQKTRCVQACAAMYSMVSRVTNLAKRCVASLHQVELQHGDASYKASGMNSFNLNRSAARYNNQNINNQQPQQY